jgi:hypothetical protein
MAVIALMAVLAGPGNATAEPTARPIAAAVARLSLAPDADAASALTVVENPSAERRGALQPQQAFPGARRSRGARIGRRIAGAAVGAVGGAFAGGYLGAKIEGGCGCDDPGLKGFLIGFPIGGVVGGVVGGLYLFR